MNPSYDARVERAFVLKVEGFDWNCPQLITPRFTKEEIRRLLQPSLAKLDSLERENQRLRASLPRDGSEAERMSLFRVAAVQAIRVFAETRRAWPSAPSSRCDQWPRVGTLPSDAVANQTHARCHR
jgi:hypothetical protein